MLVLDTLFIAPIRWLLSFLFSFSYTITNSYGFSLMILSIIVSTLLIPLYIIADRWRNKEKAHQLLMQPELDPIKKHYKGPERYYSIRATYRIYGYNPFMSLRVSFGFLIQIPFFFAAYTLLAHYEGYQGVSFGIIKNIAMPDGLFYGINLLPLLMTFINLLAGLLYVNDLNKNDTLQLLGLSLFFLVVLYNSPAGLVLYWTMNNCYALIKYSIINKPNLVTIISKVRELLKQGLTHSYTSNAIRVILITAGYLLFTYASYHHRGEEIAGVTIRLGITLLFVAILAMQAKLIVVKHYKSIAFVISIFSTICALATSIILLKNLHNANSFIFFLKFNLSINRIQQIITIMQLIALANIYPKFAKLSTSFYRVSNIMPKMIISYARAALLSFIGIYVIASPLTTYLASPEDIGGSIMRVLLAIVFSSLFIYALGYVILAILRRIYNPLYYFTVNILIWVTLIGIFYGFVLNLNLGVMHGLRFIDDKILTTINTVIILFEPFILILLFIFLLYYFPKIKKQLIFLISIITLLILGNTIRIFATNSELYQSSNNIQTSQQSNSHQDPSLLLPQYNDAVLSFSKDHNILLIILDAFPANLFEEVLYNNPALLSELDGFTWYKNTVSVTQQTYGSAAPIIGGNNYPPIHEVNPNEYIKTAWSYWPTHLPSYDITYINTWYSDNKYLSQNFSNKMLHPVRIKEDYFEYWQALHPKATATQEKLQTFFHIPKWFNVSLFKILPIHLKQKIYLDDTWKYFSTGSLNNRIYNVINFKHNFASTFAPLDSFSTASNILSPHPTLKIYWGSLHFPYYLTKDCDGVESAAILDKSFNIFQDTNARTHMLCALKGVIRWTQWMKSTDIYNNTKIIITSDHGSTYTLTDANGNSYHPDGGIFALLMVKDYNQQGTMTTSQTLMSNADIPSIISSGIHGITLHDIEPDPTKYNRTTPLTYYYVNSNPNTNTMKIQYTITVEENVYDMSSWIYTHPNNK